MSQTYLVWSMAVAGLGCAAILLARERARLVLAGGALAAPAGLADLLFVPEYWIPVHVIGAWFSIEGLLFSFGHGCLIVALAAYLEPRLHGWASLGLRRPLLRLSGAMAIGFITFLAFWEGALGRLMIMHATFAGFAAMTILLALRGTSSLRGAWPCGIAFLVLYGAETVIAYHLDPGFSGFWPHDASYLLRLPFPPYFPVEEYLWAFFYGTLWAALFLDAFVPDAHAPTPLTSSGGPGRREC